MAGRFKKGEPRPANAGRRKGSLNKKRLYRVSERLIERDESIVDEILDDIKQIEDPATRAKIRLQVLEYCEPKCTRAEAPSIVPEVNVNLEGLPINVIEEMARNAVNADNALPS